MYFHCQLQVLIGGKLLRTVSGIKTRNESTAIGSECDIEVPLNCRIQYVNGKNDFLTGYPQNLFNVGDPVTVTASYEGFPNVAVFTGFVTDFLYGMPMRIRCSDYIYNLNQGVITINNETITLKNLITRILQGTGVSLILPVFDLTLLKITFRLMSPAAILEYLKKNIGLNISLQGNQLYVNVASNTRGHVFHRTGPNANRQSAGNVIVSNLQQPNTIFQNYRVKCWFVNENGTKSSIEVGNTAGRLREQWFYKIPVDAVLYQKLATEALNKVKMEKFTGWIETYLYPDCDLFDLATFTSLRYPATNGDYVITAMNFDFGAHGFHRKIKYAMLNLPDNG